jgi:hypothetical protein
VIEPTGSAFFRFSPVGYAVDEGAGFVEIRVEKTGGAGRINYATVNGTAVAANAEGFGDYVPASGVLNFSTLETEKLIRIEVVDDLGIEGDQFFLVRYPRPGMGVRFSGSPMRWRPSSMTSLFVLRFVSGNGGSYGVAARFR